VVAVRQVHDAVLDDLRLASVLEGRRQRLKWLDALFHFRNDGLEQAGDLRPGFDLLPFAVSLIGQVDDLGLQLQDPFVGRVVVREVLVLAAGPLGRRRLPTRPLHVFVDPARGDVGHDGATDLELPGNIWLRDAIRDGLLDLLNLLLGQLHGVSLSQSKAQASRRLSCDSGFCLAFRRFLR